MDVTEEVDKDPLAYTLEIRRHANGSIDVAINNGKRISLGPRLADVFKFISTGDQDPDGRDPLVGWRSRTAIIAHLEKLAGKPFPRAYINKMVYLLKRALRNAEYDGKLIQTHEVQGIRLAYKYPGWGKPHPRKGGSSPQS
jgi:hypothetical protein